MLQLTFNISWCFVYIHEEELIALRRRAEREKARERKKENEIDNIQLEDYELR